VTRRRRSFLLLFGGPVLCGLLVAALATAAWLVAGRPTPAAAKVWLQIEQVGETHYSGAPDEILYFLALGNDGREGIGGQRGDAIHVIGVNPAVGGGTIIDIPRDTEASIPGYGAEKINAAFAYGGLTLMTETVEQLVGVDITYAVTTDFDGFIEMIDEIGGVVVDVLEPHDDEFSGAFFEPGTILMSGDDALRFNRDRHSFGTGDIKRSENQGYFILEALATIQENSGGAAGTLRNLAILARHTQIEGATLVDLFRLGRLAMRLDPAQIRNVVIPVGSAGGSNLSPAPAASLFADFADDAILQNN
jgi:LCP family protein required for cell wall assembly